MFLFVLKVLAACGGADLWTYAREVYFRNNSESPFTNLLSRIVKVCHCDEEYSSTHSKNSDLLWIYLHLLKHCCYTERFEGFDSTRRFKPMERSSCNSLHLYKRTGIHHIMRSSGRSSLSWKGWLSVIWFPTNSLIFVLFHCCCCCCCLWISKRHNQLIVSFSWYVKLIVQQRCVIFVREMLTRLLNCGSKMKSPKKQKPNIQKESCRISLRKSSFWITL